MIGGLGNFIISATDPAGPWSDPVPLHFDGIDPSLFRDPATGRCYVVNNGPPEGDPAYDGHRAIWWQEIDLPARRMIGPRRVVIDAGVRPSDRPIWIEGPRMFVRDGWYFLTAAEGGTGEEHSQTIWRSRRVEGPYLPWSGNPILTQRDVDPSLPGSVTCAGHADLIETADGDWWSVFLGCRPWAGLWYATGRETFLHPVRWSDDGWPVILPPGTRLPAELPAPAAAVCQAPRADADGWTYRTGFAGARPDPCWLRLFGTDDEWFATGPAGLELRPRRNADAPAFLGRRIEDRDFVAEATVEPLAEAAAAGLAAIQGPRHQVVLSVSRMPAGAVIRLEVRCGDDAPRRLSAGMSASQGRFDLRIECRGGRIACRYRGAGGGAWLTLAADIDARLLTTRAAGGFVGATVGPIALTGVS